jgi:hypothetical protein
MAIQPLPGVFFSVDNAITAKATSTTFSPLVALRPVVGASTASPIRLIIPQEISVVCTTQIHEVRIVRSSAAITNASFATATLGTATSYAEYDVAGTAVPAGDVLYSDYILAGGKINITDIIARIFEDNPLQYATTNDQVIVATRTLTSTGTAVATISFKVSGKQ